MASRAEVPDLLHIRYAEIDLRINLIQQEIDRRFETGLRECHAAVGALKELVLTRFDLGDKALQAALLAAETAVAKAEVANEKRLDSVNEFRQQQGDLIRDFLTRNEFGLAHAALEEKTDSAVERGAERVSELDKKVNALELRLTSRLDLTKGESDSTKEGKVNARENINTKLIGFTVAVSVVVVIVNVIIALVAHV